MRAVRSASLVAFSRWTVLGWLCGAVPAFGATYDELRFAAIRKCEGIDPGAYQTGLVFNPAGHRSYYLQSQCFQDAAVRFRDEALCSRVKQRWSLFSSSWGYAPARCLTLVAEGMAADRQTLEDLKRRFEQQPLRLRDFRVERNGNGRDFDILPAFEGAFAHGYTLSFAIIGGNVPIVISSSGFYLDGRSNISVFVRQADLAARVPQFALSRDHVVRALLVLDVGNGSPSGHWSEPFIGRVFPVRDRSQSLTKSVRF